MKLFVQVRSITECKAKVTKSPLSTFVGGGNHLGEKGFILSQREKSDSPHVKPKVRNQEKREESGP